MEQKKKPMLRIGKPRPAWRFLKHNTTEKKNILHKILSSIDSITKGQKNKTKAGFLLHYAKTTALYAAATAFMIVLIFGSISAFQMRLGNEVFVDGHSMGLITDKGAFEELLVKVGQEIDASVGNGEGVIKTATYIPRIVAVKEVTPAEQLHQNLLATYENTVPAYSIYYGDLYLASVLDEDAANKALEEIKAMYTEDAASAVTTTFAEAVSVKQEIVTVGKVRSNEHIREALLSVCKKGAQVHTVAENETLWHIAQQYDCTVEELIAVNNGNIPDIIHEGDEIIIEREQPVMEVLSTYTVAKEQEIPYEVEQIKDNTMNEGTRSVISAGVSGRKMVKQEVTKRNDMVIAQNVLEENVLSEPTVQVEKIGTKPVPKKGLTTGDLLRPAYGTLTSRFGRRRSGNHTGIDWACSTGTPIKAADGGTVSYSGWNGGYGKVVIIRHANGMETYYAHCSSLLVSTGDKVAKGDVIAKSGNTGNSTGPHLHFEVRVNGVPQNPEKYL